MDTSSKLSFFPPGRLGAIPRRRVPNAGLTAAIFIFSTGLGTSVASAGINLWTSGGPAGGQVSTLAIDPSKSTTLYAGTQFGVFKSVDGGGSWTDLGLTFNSIRALVIDPIVTT